VEAWLREEFAKTPPPFYFSVDLRSNGGVDQHIVESGDFLRLRA